MVLPWISVFLVLFSGGTLLFTASVPRKEVGDRFYRINGLIALFLGVTAALTCGALDRPGTYWPIVAYAGAVFALSIVSPMRWFRFHGPAYLLLAAAALGCAVFGRREGFGIGVLVEYGLASQVLGAALVSMLLGHSYLESGNQSFDLLINACRALLIALMLRGIAGFVSFWPDRSIVEQWMSRDMVLVVFAALRFVVGIVCAIVLAWMSLSCAKIKANQSATGILYVVVGFVIIGELVAAYLAIEKGVAL